MKVLSNLDFRDLRGFLEIHVLLPHLQLLDEFVCRLLLNAGPFREELYQGRTFFALQKLKVIVKKAAS